MPVRQDLDQALKEAMKNKDEASLASIRAVKSALKLAEIDKKREYAEEEIHALIQTAIKQRRPRETTVGPQPVPSQLSVTPAPAIRLCRVSGWRRAMSSAV